MMTNSLFLMVPGDEIEPPTRGFSVNHLLLFLEPVGDKWLRFKGFFPCSCQVQHDKTRLETGRYCTFTAQSLPCYFLYSTKLFSSKNGSLKNAFL